jgi:hypothetical protein
MEAKMDSLASENRALAESKAKVEQSLQEVLEGHQNSSRGFSNTLDSREALLKDKDDELERLKSNLNWLHNEVTRLTEENEGLTATTTALAATHNERYTDLQSQHDEKHQQLESTSRELDDLRNQHGELSNGMDGVVRREIDSALQDKNTELDRLREDLNSAQSQIHALQQQILSSRSNDSFLVSRDEDYFDNECQKLCQHVQQWVLRFSKFSDMRGARLADEVSDEKIVDRLENAILDGTDVDEYLADRIKRRDVFMSVVMTMVWEFIFTRYLFGMDREQRQKLKALEKILMEVGRLPCSLSPSFNPLISNAGPESAVQKWRATTLTLLSKRPAFQAQRESDTEAVVQDIYHTLSSVLPPPMNLTAQITDSLRNVLNAAVELSIEMRTQTASYMMLPPLQPEYDTHGDLARKVSFNAAMMNERNGGTETNEELEEAGAVVRMVLFPLVVNRAGEDGEEIIVCPAQVLVGGRPKRVGFAASPSAADYGPRASGQSLGGEDASMI